MPSFPYLSNRCAYVNHLGIPHWPCLRFESVDGLKSELNYFISKIPSGRWLFSRDYIRDLDVRCIPAGSPPLLLLGLDTVIVSPGDSKIVDSLNLTQQEIEAVENAYSEDKTGILQYGYHTLDEISIWCEDYQSSLARRYQQQVPTPKRQKKEPVNVTPSPEKPRTYPVKLWDENDTQCPYKQAVLFLLKWLELTANAILAGDKVKAYNEQEVVHARNVRSTMYVCGRPGTGKTSATEYLVNHFEKKWNTNGNRTLKVVKVNCASNPNVTKAVLECCQSSSMMAVAEMTAKSIFLLIILDECDFISQSRGLSELTRLAGNTTNKVVIIGTGNTMAHSKVELLRRNFSSVITFSDFRPKKLGQIMKRHLKDRKSIDDKAIEFIAKSVGQSQGDARKALKQLERVIEGRKNRSLPATIGDACRVLNANYNSVEKKVKEFPALVQEVLGVICYLARGKPSGHVLTYLSCYDRYVISSSASSGGYRGELQPPFNQSDIERCIGTIEDAGDLIIKADDVTDGFRVCENCDVLEEAIRCAGSARRCLFP